MKCLFVTRVGLVFVLPKVQHQSIFSLQLRKENCQTFKLKKLVQKNLGVMNKNIDYQNRCNLFV